MLAVARNVNFPEFRRWVRNDRIARRSISNVQYASWSKKQASFSHTRQITCKGKGRSCRRRHVGTGQDCVHAVRPQHRPLGPSVRGDRKDPHLGRVCEEPRHQIDPVSCVQSRALRGCQTSFRRVSSRTSVDDSRVGVRTVSRFRHGRLAYRPRVNVRLPRRERVQRHGDDSHIRRVLSRFGERTHRRVAANLGRHVRPQNPTPHP